MPMLIPTLRIASEVKLRKTRRLPMAGDVLVDIGEQVNPDDVVARATVIGRAVRLNLIEALGLRASEEAARYLLKAPGDSVELGEEFARKEGRLGRGARSCVSPIDGRIASGPTMSGEILITPHSREFELQAMMTGRIVGVLPQRGAIIEGAGAYVQTIACLGGETKGMIKLAVAGPAQALDADVGVDFGGAVLVAGSAGEPALRAALFQGASAVIVGSITAATFRWLRENPQPVTVMVTEGFGVLPMAQRTFDLLRANNGCLASLFTQTENGQSVGPAEIFIPSESSHDQPGAEKVALGIGSTVRIVRGSKFGTLARVLDLPRRSGLLESGVHSELIDLAVDGGQTIRVSRNNVELVG